MLQRTSPGSRALPVMLYSMNYAPEITGTGRYAGEIGDYLNARNIPLEVVTAPPHYPGWHVSGSHRNRYGIERRSGMRVTRCPVWLPREVRGLKRLLVAFSFAASSAPVVIWRALRVRPHVVMVTEPAIFSAPMALLAARLAGARAVLHVQDLEVEAAFAVGHLRGELLRRISRGLERSIIQRFDQVITISERMLQTLAKDGVDPDKLSIIRNWVNIDHICPREGENPFRTAWNAGPADKVVLYSGSIGAKQALDLLIKAAERLKDRADIKFVICGDGPKKASLMASAPGNVLFLPLQPEEKLPDLLCAADIHVLPQHAGVADLVLPSKLGGMLASGRPILVQSAPGTELYDLLQGAAEIVPPGDSEALAAAIGAFEIDSPSAARRRAEIAAKLSSAWALERFYQILAAHGGAEATAEPKLDVLAWEPATASL